MRLQNDSVPIMHLIIATMMKRQRKIAKGEVVKIKGANLGKFIYSEKAIKVCIFSTVDLTATTQDTSMLEISQTFVAFSEYMNLNEVNRETFSFLI
jgi:ribosomal protein S26